MSRVIINELGYDITKPMPVEEYDKVEKILDVEIVPRKIVEMILDKCDEIREKYKDEESDSAYGRWASATEIKSYTEDLLKEFEGEDECEDT